MKKYIVIYHSTVSSADQMKNMRPEDVQAEMAKWMKWATQCGSALVDMGAPLGASLSLASDGSSKLRTEHVVGYSILEAENMDEAKKLLENHPHFTSGECSIAIHEAMPLPGM